MFGRACAEKPSRTLLCFGITDHTQAASLHFLPRECGKCTPRLGLARVWGRSRRSPGCGPRPPLPGAVWRARFPLAVWPCCHFVTFSHPCLHSHQMQRSVGVCLLREATWRGDSPGLSCPARPPPGAWPAWAPASSSAVHTSRGFQLRQH